MSPWRIILVVAAVAFALPARGLAQGLGAVAAQAREDRVQRSKQKPEPARTYTNDDLPEREESDDDSGSSDDESSSRESSSPGGESRATTEDSAEDLDRARTRVLRLEAKVEELQQRLNPMSTTYIFGATGGPVGGTQTDMEMQIRRQLDATQQQLDDARNQVSEGERGGSRSRAAPPERSETASH